MRPQLDSGEPDLAAVVHAKAAAVDDRGDAALALRLELAGRVRRCCPEKTQRQKCGVMPCGAEGPTDQTPARARAMSLRSAVV
jgi:hypothetical protein